MANMQTGDKKTCKLCDECDNQDGKNGTVVCAVCTLGDKPSEYKPIVHRDHEVLREVMWFNKKAKMWRL